MTEINYKIVGLDDARPPKIQVTPCIDLYFELNDEAPAAWCYLFQSITGRRRYPIKIDPETGLHVETWVRKPNEIAAALDTIKKIVEDTNMAYTKVLEEERMKAAVKEEVAAVSEEQLELNRVVALLDFDEAGTAEAL